MPYKTNKNTEISSSLQKVLVIAGFGLIIFTILATCFTLFSSQTYINDALSIGYYARYAITIVGGFSVGFLLAHLSRRKQRSKQVQESINPQLTGVIFALLTYSFWLLLDFARLPAREMFGDPVYPWGKVLFMGLPLGALVLIGTFGLVLYLRGAMASASQRWLQRLLVSTFVILQLASFTNIALISRDADYSGVTFAVGLISLITTPLAVAVLAYFLLRGVVGRGTSIFTGAVIGLVYEISRGVSWEFGINPEYQATLVFSAIVTSTGYALAVALILVARFTVRQRKVLKK